jgi:hypothetical protein
MCAEQPCCCCDLLPPFRWLVALLESWARQLSGPWVLAALLLAVAARHMLLPGGLVHECQKAML